MDHEKRIRLLQSIPFFQHLGPDELEEIAGLVKERTYPPHHVVIEEGQPGDSCFVVARGKVAILKDAGGGEVLLAMKQDGEFFGEMALLESTTRSATVKTVEASHLLELPGAAFQRLLQCNVTISSVMAQELSRRLRDTDSKLIAALDELSQTIRQRDAVLMPALTERMQRLAETQQRLTREHERLNEAYLDAIRAVVTLLEGKHPYDQGHSQRVAEYACQIAGKMGWSEEELTCLEIAALLHDIGRVGVPDTIFDKESQLTTSEWTLVQRYPQYGVSILRFLGFIKDALPIIESHRECWDGSGYPKGLAGEEIPLGARVLAVAEAYDAMLCDRPYRPAKTPEEAIGTLLANAGRRWDPDVVRTFLGILGHSPEGNR